LTHHSFLSVVNSRPTVNKTEVSDHEIQDLLNFHAADDDAINWQRPQKMLTK